MSLRKLLKNFCTDAYQKLFDMGEFPRPPLDSPQIADDMRLTHPLSKLTSYAQLQEYMRSSGLSDKLRDIGHTKLWHYEVFEWLFLERIIAESFDTFSLDVTAFNKVFRRAQAELSRSSFRIRRVTILNGLPELSHPISLDTGVSISPVVFSSSHYKLANLLGWKFQDRNRAPSFMIDPDSCLLIQDYLQPKGNEGWDFWKSLEQLRHQAEIVIKALKLSLDTPVYPKAVYLSYLSSFPLLPIIHTEFEEFSGFSISIQRNMTRAEITAIKRNVRFINSESQKTLDPKFSFALDRFADSFRAMQEKQSIVDLFMALEAMYGIDRGLRQRLASFTTFLLGTNDSERRIFYGHTLAGYKLRNAIVHGSKNQEKDICNALTDFFPELKGNPMSKVIPYVRKATEELQRIVRLVLRAYVYMKYNQTREEWPIADELEYLAFDSAKRRLIQKQLGITAKQPLPPSWHF